MMNLIDKIPLIPLAIFATFMILAPFQPEPHLWEKLKMLSQGTLVKPIDIFDLFWHGIWPVLLVIRAYREFTK